jgi:hypothetical protein
MGYSLALRGTQGRTNCIKVDPTTGELVGAADLRDPDSGAAGY